MPAIRLDPHGDGPGSSISHPVIFKRGNGACSCRILQKPPNLPPRPVDDGPREDVFLRHGLPVVARAVAGDVARAFVEVPINLQPIPQTLGLAGNAAEGKCERRPCGGLEA